MNKKISSDHGVDFPAERRAMPTINELNSRKHFMGPTTRKTLALHLDMDRAGVCVEAAGGTEESHG